MLFARRQQKAMATSADGAEPASCPRKHPLTRSWMQNAILMDGARGTQQTWGFAPSGAAEAQLRRSRDHARLRLRTAVPEQPVPPPQLRPQAPRCLPGLPSLPPRAPCVAPACYKQPAAARIACAQPPPRSPPCEEPHHQRAASPGCVWPGLAVPYGVWLQFHAEAMQTLSQP